MTRNDSPVRRPVAVAAALGAILVLGGCETLGETFEGINPVTKELEKSAIKGGGDGKAEQLATPPGYGQRPTARKASGSDTRSPEAAPKAGAAKAPEKAGDRKKIDLKTGTGGESIESRTLDTNRKIVREDRVETRGKEIVDEGDPSKGEKELLKPPAKKKS